MTLHIGDDVCQIFQLWNVIAMGHQLLVLGELIPARVAIRPLLIII